MSDSLRSRPHGLPHARLLRPPLSPGVCSNSCPLSQWCHPTILSSVSLFSSCPKSFASAVSFPMTWLFPSGGQSIGASASALVFSMNIEGWFLLGLTGLILTVCGTLKSLLQHNSKASVLRCSAFLMVQFSYLYMTTGKNHSFDYMDLCWQSDVSAF